MGFSQSQNRYKLSQYNVFHQDGDVQYMWNTFSEALLKLDKDAQKYLQNFSGTDDSSVEFNTLKSNGFIVIENLDEFGRICTLEKRAMFTHPSKLSFVIAPGMRCNYNCSYCFESSSDLNGAMTKETAVAVADYVCKQLIDNVKDLHISWFGGEPLLYLSSIESISNPIIEYSLQNGIEFAASIITNGRFLDAETLTRLQELHVQRAQITVDGTHDAYCSSKGASADDFHHVIENICHAADKIKVTVRLNVPNNDVNEAIAITDYLLSKHNLRDKIGIYFAFVRDYSLSKSKTRQSFINYVYNNSQWIDYFLEHYGIPQNRSHISKRVATSCGLIRASNFCVGPYGELYKCEHCFGDNSMVVGDIWQGQFYNNTEHAFCATLDTSNAECSRCKFIPICMGGCAYNRVLGLVGFDCDAFKQMQFKLKLMEGGVHL